MIQDVRDITSFKWATVTGTNPTAIQLDGDSEPLALIPDTLVDPLTLSVGDRVRVELSLRKVVIHGKADGNIQDTGWVDLSGYLVAGFTGAIHGRRIGAHAELRSNGILGSVPSSSSLAVNVLNALPVEWRPNQNAWGIAVSSTFQTGGFLMRSIGTAGIAQNSGVAWTSVRVDISYFTG